MPVARDLLILAAAALAWLAYAVFLSQAEPAPAFVFPLTRTLALGLSAVLVVRLLGAGILNVLVEPIWGVAATSLMRVVVYLLLGATAAGLVLKAALDVNVTTLLTTSALLTAIIGFALQPTLSAFFSGVALELERDVQVGDAVRIGERWSIVENIGWRSMTARRGDGSIVVVPHTTLAGTPLPLRQKGSVIVSEVLLPGPISVPPAAVAEIIADAVSGIAEVSDDHPVGVYLAALHPAEGTADFFTRFYTRLITTDEQAMGAIARLRLWYAYQRHAVTWPRSTLFPDPPSLAPLTPLALDHPDAPLAMLAAAIGRTRRWGMEDEAARLRLARQGRRLLYAAQEPLWPPAACVGATAVVVSGTIRFGGEDVAALSGIEPAAVIETGPDAVAGWDRAALQPVAARLAESIGPYAQIAVRRAAARTADPAELYRRLAELIPAAGERDHFLHAAPAESVRDFGPGSVVPLRRLRPMRLLPTALEPVELLVLPRDV